MRHIAWNVSNIFHHFGGVNGVLKEITDSGVLPQDKDSPPSQAAVKMWKSRGAIPQEWLAVLLHLAPVEKAGDFLQIITVQQVPDEEPDPFEGIETD